MLSAHRAQPHDRARPSTLDIDAEPRCTQALPSREGLPPYALRASVAIEALPGSLPSEAELRTDVGPAHAGLAELVHELRTAPALELEPAMRLAKPAEQLEAIEAG